MPIPGYSSISDQIAETNAKAFGDAGAAVALISSQSAAAHGARMNVHAENFTNGWTKLLMEPDVMQAAATQKIFTGRDSLQVAEVAALSQIFTKAAQTTPPVTGVV